MRRSIFIISILSAASLHACGGDDASDRERESEDAIDARIPQADVVAIVRPGFSCPPAPTWRQNGSWKLSSGFAPPLERYCVYTWHSVINDMDEHDIEGTAFEAVKADNPAVMPLAGEDGTNGGNRSLESPSRLAAAFAPDLYAAYAAQLRVPNLPSIGARSGVRLAIVDTIPEGAPKPRSLHAPTLAALARRTLCEGESSCAARVVHHLALPRVHAAVTDRVNGGHYGTLFDLALAISEAVNSASPLDRLVINLSVGWEEEMVPPNLPSNHLDLLSLQPNNVEPAVRAVHRALVYARCKNALIVAAAGNDLLIGPPATGRMYPGGFADLVAPSRADCRAFFAAEGDAAPVGEDQRETPRPLLYAIGGLDHRDAPITNTRVNAIPELAAAAEVAALPTGGNVYTGTSVGAVSASAVAAIVWSIRGELDGDGALSLVKDTAEVLPFNANLCFRADTGSSRSSDVACGAVRRISSCEAQRRACAGNGSCRAMTCSSSAPEGYLPGSAFVRALIAMFALNVPVLDLGPYYSAPAQNGVLCDQVSSLNIPGQNWTCPLDNEAAARNLDVGPQPIDPVCPACFVYVLQGKVNLNLALRNNIPGHKIYSAMLNVYGYPGTGNQRFALPTPMNESTIAVLNLGSPSTLTLPIHHATLTYYYYEGTTRYAAGEPILLH